MPWVRDNDDIFLLELLCKDIEERGLLLALWEDPEDKAAVGAYADFLDDKGRQASAAMLRVESGREGSYRPGMRWESPSIGSIVASGFMMGQPVGLTPLFVTSGVNIPQGSITAPNRPARRRRPPGTHSGAI